MSWSADVLRSNLLEGVLSDNFACIGFYISLRACFTVTGRIWKSCEKCFFFSSKKRIWCPSHITSIKFRCMALWSSEAHQFTTEKFLFCKFARNMINETAPVCSISRIFLKVVHGSFPQIAPRKVTSFWANKIGIVLHHEIFNAHKARARLPGT